MIPLLQIKKLNTGFRMKKDKVVSLHRDLYFSVQSGEFITVLGPNGAGKSTLLRTVLGYQKSLKGEVIYGNEHLDKLTAKELATKVAVVLTDQVDESFLTVFDVVATGRYPHSGISGRLTSDDIRLIEEAVELVGMSDFIHRYFYRLSDGEKQKVMIARTVAQQTQLIILDEPVAYVDAPSKVEIMDLLLLLSHQHGKGILMATHDLETAFRFSDKLWLLGTNGKSVEGTPKALLDNGTMNQFFDKQDVVLNREKLIFEKKINQNNNIYNE